MSSQGLPPTRRNPNGRSYFFKASREDQVRVMGPYPTPEYAIAVRETMRSIGYQVGQIADG